MFIPTKFAIRILLTIICSFTMLFIGNVSVCHAKEKQVKQQYSKDYKKFPAGSPEAVLTKFVESDFKDTEDRYLNLTECGDIPNCGYPSLLINSYKIVGKPEDKQTDDVTLNLEVDVRAIELGTNKNANVTCKDKILYVNNKKHILSNVTSTSNFIETILEQSAQTQHHQVREYPVSKDKRKWIFPIRMMKKHGKWLIATESIPLIATYISEAIKTYINEISVNYSMNEVCNGTLSIQRYFKERRQLDISTAEIGTNLNKFKAEYCAPDEIKTRIKFIEHYKQSIQELREWQKD